MQLRNPILINDVHQQTSLLDRREVYNRLSEYHVPTPQHIVVNRTEQQAAAGEDPEGFVETPDYVSMVRSSSFYYGVSTRAVRLRTTVHGFRAPVVTSATMISRSVYGFRNAVCLGVNRV